MVYANSNKPHSEYGILVIGGFTTGPKIRAAGTSKMPIAALSTAKATASRSRNNATRLFGYDVFISFALGPPPRGSHSYASDLARRLRELDFSVFFSEDETAPGSVLDSTLKRALARSRILVVIANRGTLLDPRWVRTEVEEFRQTHPARAVIPISIDGALLDRDVAAATESWLRFTDKIWIDESREAAAQGIVSDAVVARLATAPHSLRANTRWRFLVRATVALLAGLVVLLAWQTKVARDSQARAVEELRRITSLRLVTDSREILAGERNGAEERALLELIAAERLAPSVAAESALQQSLMRLARLRKLIDLGAGLSAAAFSPDATHFVSAHGATLRIWDTRTGAPAAAPISAHGAEITAVAFSGDGRLLATADHKGALRMWDPIALQPIGSPLRAHGNLITSVAVSPDGTRIATGAGGDPLADMTDRHAGRTLAPRDYTVRLWDTRSGRSIGSPLAGHRGAVRLLAFSASGEDLISSGDDGTLRVWRLGRLPMVHVLEGLGRAANAAAFYPGAQLIALGTDEGALLVWNRSALPARAMELDHYPAAIIKLQFDDDGKRLAAYLSDGQARQWDFTARKSTQLRAAISTGEVAALSRDGSIGLSTGADSAMRLWMADAQTTLAAPAEAAGSALAFSANSRYLATSGNPATSIQIVDGTAGKLLATSPAPPDGLETLAIATRGEGRWILVDAAGMIELYDDKSPPRVIRAPRARERVVARAAVSADGSVAALLEREGALRFFDTASGKPIGETLQAPPNNVRSLALSADGRLAAYCGEREVRAWRVGAAEMSASTSIDFHCMALAFAPDANRLALGGVNQGRVLDLRDTPPRGVELEEVRDGLMSLAFSADGKRIVGGSNVGPLYVWDAQTGQRVMSALDAHRGIVRAIAASADGAWLGSTDGHTVLLWPAPSTWPDRLCSKLTQNMSRANWNAWVSREVPYTCQCPALPVAADEDSGQAAASTACSQVFPQARN